MISSKKLSSVEKLTISGIIIALYTVIMIFTQSFAFMQHQIRIATSLYALSALFPFLILPMGLSNLLSNTLMGGLGPLDSIGGFMVGILTSAVVYLIRKHKWNDMFIALPIIFIPGLLVPIWLSYLLKVPYPVMALDLCLGQVIPGISGVLLIKALNNIKLFN